MTKRKELAPEVRYREFLNTDESTTAYVAVRGESITQASYGQYMQIELEIKDCTRSAVLDFSAYVRPSTTPEEFERTMDSLDRKAEKLRKALTLIDGRLDLMHELGYNFIKEYAKKKKAKKAKKEKK